MAAPLTGVGSTETDPNTIVGPATVTTAVAGSGSIMVTGPATAVAALAGVGVTVTSPSV